jgi:hypothetical protein
MIMIVVLIIQEYHCYQHDRILSNILHSRLTPCIDKIIEDHQCGFWCNRSTAEETEYMVMSCCQNAEQNHNLVTANKSLENLQKFTYLGITVTNQNCIQEEIKSRLNLGNALYHQFRVFCLPISFLTTEGLKYAKIKFTFCFVWL